MAMTLAAHERGAGGSGRHQDTGMHRLDLVGRPVDAATARTQLRVRRHDQQRAAGRTGAMGDEGVGEVVWAQAERRQASAPPVVAEALFEGALGAHRASGDAAIAGVMVSAYYGLAHYYMGFLLGLKAFSAAVLGGIGNLGGAMLGGLLLGLIESFGAGYIGDLTGGFLGSHYQDVFAFFVLIAVLVFRPQGLLGARVVERA